MQFILTTGWEDGIASLAERLVHELAAGKRVVWLVCGGSNIPAGVAIMSSISPNLSKGLAVTLTDERYGEVGHKDSNWTQLMNAGFKANQAKLLPVLQPGLSLKQTVARYDQMITTVFGVADCIIAQFGIGEDGHIAGILPGSVAAGEQKAMAVGYKSDPFTRLTISFPAIRQLSAAYAFAFGDTKRQALTTLEQKKLVLTKQPAQILKQLDEAYVYNDQVGRQT